MAAVVGSGRERFHQRAPGFLAPLALALVASGCGLGAADNFTRGLEREACEGTFPVCQTTAGCVLRPGRYVEGRFPGSRQVIVPALAESVITVRIYFVTQVAAGVDTEILWHEPGCFDTYQDLSEGRDLFREAGPGRVFSRSQQVFLEGDHLVEVYSDAVGEYLLTVDVDAPGGRVR